MAKLGDTLTTRDALRRAVTDDIVGRAQAVAVAVDGEGPLAGVEVVSLGTLRQIVTDHLDVRLPPPSEHHAEVTSPATVTVTNICPECDLPSKTTVKATTVLTVTDEGSEISTKLKTKAAPHLCGQLQLEEAGDQAAGQISVDEAVGEIDELRIRILRAVADVSDAWGNKADGTVDGPPPTLDAIAKALELVSESDIGDLEESLHAYSQAETPLVDVVSAKGSPVHYVLTEAGIDLVAAADEAAGDDGFTAEQGRAALDELNDDLDGEEAS